MLSVASCVIKVPQFAFLPAAGGDLRRQGAVKLPCHTAKSAGVLGYCTACFIFSIYGWTARHIAYMDCQVYLDNRLGLSEVPGCAKWWFLVFFFPARLGRTPHTGQREENLIA